MRDTSKIYLIATMLAMSVATNAQTEQKRIEGDIFVISKVFTHGDNLYVISVSEEGEVSVYDDDLEFIRSFTLNAEKYTLRREYQEREPEVKTTSIDAYRKVVAWDETTQTWAFDDWSGTWNDAKAWAASTALQTEGLSLEESDHYQLWPTDEGWYWEYSKYGKSHPTTYFQWNAEDGTISQMNVSYEEGYTGNWKTTEEVHYTSSSIESVYLMDFDNNSHPDYDFMLTQTLFNTDEKFEYITPIYEESEYILEENDWDGDGEIDHRRVEHSSTTIGYRIVSEDGTILQTIEDKGYMHWGGDNGIYLLNGKTYLLLTDPGDETIFYRIDQQTSSIKQVNTLPTSPKRAIYSTDGRQHPHLHRGINIVRETDGSVNKYLLK